MLKLAPDENTVTTVPFTGLSGSKDVTVGRNGTIYVADSAGVFKLEAGATSSTHLPTAGLRSPRSVTVDSTGTVYVTDEDDERGRMVATYRLLKLTPGDSSWTVISSGPTYPSHVVVNRADTLYVMDEHTHMVVKQSSGSSSWAETALTIAIEELATALVVDDAGAVYLATLRIEDSSSPNSEDWVVKSTVFKLAPGAEKVSQLPVADDVVFVGLTFDSGRVYVADERCTCVLRFTP